MAEERARKLKGPGGRRNMGPRPKLEHPGRTLRRVFGYLMKLYGLQMAVVVVLIFVGVLANVQGTMFMQTLIDDYIMPMLGQEHPDFGPLGAAIGRVACFYALGVASSFIYNQIMIYVTQGTLRSLRDDLFTHMQTLPIRYFDTHAHGDIMSIYTNDIDTLRQMVSQSIPQFVNSLVTIVSVLYCMIVLSLPLTGLTLAMVCVMLVCTGRLAGNSGRYFMAQQKDLGKVNGFIEETMEGQKVVKVFCHEEESIRAFNEMNDRLFDSAKNANTFANILMPVNAQIGNISYVLIAMVGGAMALNHMWGFTLGGLASFLTFNKSFNMPINQISQQLNSIVMALAGADRVFGLLDEEPEVDNGYVTLVNAVRDKNGKLAESEKRTGLWAWKHTHTDGSGTDYVELTGDVVFDDVDFGYNPDKIVLHNVDLFATPGQKIAFVGSTGAGKTTIAAAQLANADGFIRRLPQGYQTVLTGDGANLSQGQRQLLAIARAAVADPPVLILDEATSSIDTRTERIVQEGMDKLMKGRTTFVIAHRLSTIRNSDCIMVLERGRIIERGNHEELIEQKGKYYQLYTGKIVNT